MLNDYASANGTEVWNTTRLQAYLTNVGSPFDTGPDICHCPSLTAEVLGDDPYTTPDAEVGPAPWYDPAVPESAEFLGFLPLTVAGADDNPRRRTVSTAVGGGGVFGPSREQPRSIVVTGVLIGATCCGAQYGMQFLSELLSGCTGDTCDGDCFAMYNCCPDDGLTPEQFNAAHRRTFRRTSLVEGPTETGRRSTGDCARSECAAGAELIEVEFVLVAASPWAWTDPIPVLEVTPPIADQTECVDWCLPGSGIPDHDCDPTTCLFQACVTPGDPYADPRNQVPLPPQPTVPAGSFCAPLVPDRACYSVDLSARPQWATDAPLIEIYSGAYELRNIRVTWYERPAGFVGDCDDLADSNLCNFIQDFTVTYIPPRGTLTLDGSIGRAVVTAGGLGCRTASTAYGNQNGGPVDVTDLTCATYCICIETDSDAPPAADAVVRISVLGKGY
ncbi:minor tail protein [Streptomyces phage Maih]|uniref:Minor tail protein n=5 Tax=Woodruffvirus TP1604 TaxID=1982746 RepID=A0A1P8VW11_9CAUD|nr:minor tail protein [Streptomyces phage TP1604]ALY07271.1 minor tail protein [Streptomyces phage Maih]APZ82189.1 minor tail protein [Streptomyces phage BabyGotBac]AWN08381.1 minor tail protein [Streptomyces phage BayC]AWN08452.1 minor tail protein [Streptomyces phage Salete]USH45396.1 minor tail protein [Streptomyces phage Asis]